MKHRNVHQQFIPVEDQTLCMLFVYFMPYQFFNRSNRFRHSPSVPIEPTKTFTSDIIGPSLQFKVVHNILKQQGIFNGKHKENTSCNLVLNAYARRISCGNTLLIYSAHSCVMNRAYCVSLNPTNKAASSLSDWNTTTG